MVQAKSKPSIEEINAALFGEDEEKKNSSVPNQTQPRLLKQRGLSTDELESVPYYKKPGVQIAALLAVAFPFTWGLVSAFFPGESNPQSQEANTPQDKENQLLKQSLEQERKKNQDLAIEKGLRTQQMEVVRVKQSASAPIPKPQQPPSVKPAAVRPISVPTRPRTIYVPVRAKPSPPIQQPTVTKPLEPEIDPMEQWLAEANRGHYIGASGNSAYSTNAQNAVYTQDEQGLQESSQAVVSDVPDSSTNEAENNSSWGGTNTLSSDSLQGMQSESSQLSELYSSKTPDRSISENKLGSQIQQQELDWTNNGQNSSTPSTDGRDAQEVSGNASSVSSYSTQSLSQRAMPNSVPLNSQENISSDDARQMGTIAPPEQIEHSERQVFQNEAASVEQAERFLDIGSSAEAELQTGIAWTEQGLQQNRNYLLRLEESFKNGMGQEVLPSGTRLIVRVTETSNSGLFFAEVTHILLGQQRLSVPPGAMQLVADDGSPLKADLKRKGGPGFLETVGTIVAPGVEKAMGSLANSADSLILEDGDRSLIRTSGGNDNPVAAGLSGVATGASRVFSNQLQSRQNQQSAPYFQFDSGETVRIIVNEDFFLTQN